ncbi:MAG: hypothetical protein JSU95_05230 [Betaproteobacteria bacterium]|nr:MAG: hypothetical protein JSU95_05230 [Betaproteobacteria bacterium]
MNSAFARIALACLFAAAICTTNIGAQDFSAQVAARDFSAQVAAREMQLEVIELYTRSADEMVQLLKPMLAPGGTISGSRDKLVIRTTPQNLKELRMIIDQVDAPPRRLRITVRQDIFAPGDERGVEVSGSVGNDGVRVTIPPNTSKSTTSGATTNTDDENRVRIRVESTQTRDTGSTVQTVQVNEGQAAFIALGESIPIRTYSVAVGVVGFAAGETVVYRDVEAGFFAVARMRGDEVTVQVSSSADAVLSRRTGAVRIERVSSVLSGRAGEWLEVGSVTLSADREETGITSYRSNASRDQRRTRIKVEEIR